MVRNMQSLKHGEVRNRNLCEMTLVINDPLGIPENYKEVISD